MKSRMVVVGIEMGKWYFHSQILALTVCDAAANTILLQFHC